MSVIVCSLSGSPLTQAVISLKTGHIYQKSTITKHLQTTPTCPHTNQPLSLTDLLPLATNSTDTTITNAQYTDTDKIITKLQAEYEALVLEAHFLKDSLRESRQELGQALYRQDAGIRVIGRLEQEVEENKGVIAGLVAQLKAKRME